MPQLCLKDGIIVEILFTQISKCSYYCSVKICLPSVQIIDCFSLFFLNCYICKWSCLGQHKMVYIFLASYYIMH
jgi:hypothetical protein